MRLLLLKVAKAALEDGHGVWIETRIGIHYRRVMDVELPPLIIAANRLSHVCVPLAFGIAEVPSKNLLTSVCQSMSHYGMEARVGTLSGRYGMILECLILSGPGLE